MPATGIRLAEMIVLEMAVGLEMGAGSAAGTAYPPNMLAATAHVADMPAGCSAASAHQRDRAIWRDGAGKVAGAASIAVETIRPAARAVMTMTLFMAKLLRSW